jgi:TPR repeat protein
MWRTTFVLILAGCGGAFGSGRELDDREPIGDCGSERRCTRACDDGDRGACVDLGDSYDTRDRLDEAADAYDRGCELGVAAACARLVSALRRLGREGEAAGVVRDACGDSAGATPGVGAERCRAVAAELGSQGPEPEVESELHRRCDAGDAIACRDVGRALQARGELDEAVAPLRVACREGDVDGCIGLSDVLDRLGREALAAEARERARTLGAEE